MQECLTNLHPQRVFFHFNNILNIPHTSGNEAHIAQYLLDFAALNKLECRRDYVGNVVIEKKASSQAKSNITILLQAHMDMVGVCHKDKNFDFSKDKIEAYLDSDGFIKTNGTTLGADNGIGMSMILAILEDNSLNIPNLRAIFTVEEETTMKGAINLDIKELQANYLINVDSEEDGFMYVSCAGSEDALISFKANKELVDGQALCIELSNLSGGHSGTDINYGKANAIVTLAKLLLETKTPLQIISLDGGTVRNAIANFAKAIVYINSDKEQFCAQLQHSFAKYQNIHKVSDPNMSLTLQDDTNEHKAFDTKSSLELLNLIVALPFAMLRPYDYDRTIAQTSFNLGLMQTFKNEVLFKIMYRSLNEEGLDDIKLKLQACVYPYDKAKLTFADRHPCWQSPNDNELIRALKACYLKTCNKELKITAMSAGLECAFFAKANPNLQLVSIGPTILNPHSPFEKVYVKGVEEIYETLKLTLEAI